ILLSSNKTQLTMFGNKTAYPVYMIIGNIPKEIRRQPSRRAYILLEYLPTSQFAPLRVAGAKGIPIASGDGAVRRGHRIVTYYIGDYPEQLVMTCVKTDWCPTCNLSTNALETVNRACYGTLRPSLPLLTRSRNAII
ncbi:hypothetical protein DFH08DRAFT_723694, partial [Mycena albidolilacea]